MKPEGSIYSWTLAAALQTTAALTAPTGPAVDLGYATYQGYYNTTFDLNIWKGIRYAAPPVGKLRWQAPQPPVVNNGKVTLAVDQPPRCPQSGGFGLPEAYGLNPGPGDEDCLYLNVFAAPNASNLPVLVWIHGGGYSVGAATDDPSAWVNANDNGFIAVQMQYRLGAFGFLASADVKAHGQLNAGLLDQRLAFQWVQEHISKFGGDPTRVTIAGESAGAGSVLHHAMAYDGEDSDLFGSIFAASPYLPPIYGYDDTVPTALYDRFAELAGCNPKPSIFSSTFDCLVAANSSVLQNSSATVSTTEGHFGTFGFGPVVDGDYIRELPSIQSLQGRVTGKRLLVSNNANEGVPLTDPRINTRAKYDGFVSETFPSFTPDDIALLNKVYQIDSLPGDSGVPYDTLGSEGPTALYQSGMATGIQQAVFNMAAEMTFACPAQWLAEAFSTGPRRAWKYQYSLTPSYHGADLGSYFSVGVTFPNAEFIHTMQKILGNFIIHGTPVISIPAATGNYSNATVPIGTNDDVEWPEFTVENPVQMNLNTTGGDVTKVTIPPYLSYYIRGGPGIVNAFNLADSFAWEGGRGRRCDFWRTVSKRVPY